MTQKLPKYFREYLDEKFDHTNEKIDNINERLDNLNGQVKCNQNNIRKLGVGIIIGGAAVIKESRTLVFNIAKGVFGL